MNKIFTKLGMVLAFILMASSIQAHAAMVFFRGADWYHEYFYAKLPDPMAEFIPADTKDKDGVELYKRLPVGSVVCVSVTLSPGSKYANYYFTVTKEGNSGLNFYGTVFNPYYTFGGVEDGAGLNSKAVKENKQNDVCIPESDRQ